MVQVSPYTYSPYGVSGLEGTSGNPIRYTGRRLDVETGLYYYRVRYYSPALGRFLKTDPIGYGDGMNWYAYVANDPVTYNDPTGSTRLYYNTTRAELTVVPERQGAAIYVVTRATSGRGQSMNVASDFRIRNQGPIPPGRYTLNTSKLSDPNPAMDVLRGLRNLGDWGDWRAPLTPDPRTDTLDQNGVPRDGFFLHGGIKEGSAGCIDIGGGLWGNSDSTKIKNDIMSDEDGSVPLIVTRGDDNHDQGQTNNHLPNQEPWTGGPWRRGDGKTCERVGGIVQCF